MKKSGAPPSLAFRFLRLFLRPDLVDEVTGDLTEMYDETRTRRSHFASQVTTWYQVICYVRPFALRRILFTLVNPYPMYQSYFRTSVRSMLKNKLHTFINITGLSVGMAIALLIVLWITDELSYEKNFDNYRRIGQVIQNVSNNGEIQTWNSVPYPLADEIRKNYGSDFQYVALTAGNYPHLLTTETKKLNRTGIYAEPDFIKILSLRLTKGSLKAISDPTSVYISSSTATTYFGDRDPIGQGMTIDHEFNVTVAGVYPDMPRTTNFSDLHFIASWDLLYNGTGWIKSMEDPWRPNAFSLFVQLQEHATFNAASQKIRDAKLKKVNESLARKKPELFIHPMSEWHLNDKFVNGKNAGGRIQYVWLFGIIGTFVLLMACINFMNLSTAQSEKRAKEVGIRKAVGSGRAQLISQFFSESVVTSLFSLAVALVLMQLLIPAFNQVAEKQVFLEWTNPVWWSLGIAFSLVIGLVAGSYPALYLSSITAGRAIKGVYKASRFSSLPRKGLVVVQFTVSIILIIGTFVVFLQIEYAKDRPIGYESDGLVSVPSMSSEIHKHFDAIKDELIKSGAIVAIAESEAPTTEQWSTSSQFEWTGKDPDLSVDFPVYGVSIDYGTTIDWEMKSGRDFSRDYPSDSTALILNESAVSYMGLKNPIGETIRWGGQAFQVVGVIKDIVVRSPYQPISPTLYYMVSSGASFTIMRLDPTTSTASALERIESTFRKYNQDMPFTYEFTDIAYAKKFGNEERVGKLATIFSALAVLISCLGIFGLSSFIAEQRTKEIGIRKVMGASLFELWRLMSTDFILLVLAACVVAIPVALWALSSWLENFQYRLTIPVWIFLIATVGTLVITMATVSWHTINAARINPVKSLRAE